jgi:signal recognition particle receptor subunit beta
MAFVNYNNKEITVKIVYYGPALSGKTTCLKYIYSCPEFGNKGKLITLDTDGDRTLFFDFLPLEIGKLGDYSIKIQLYTVPGQVAYDTTRKLVLQGADGIVFVADSQMAIRDQNLESWNNMKKNLELNNISPTEIPIVLQYNKRDLKEILPIDELNKDLNPDNKSFFPTVATTGENILEGLHASMKLVIIYLKNRLSVFQKDKTVMFSRDEITSKADKGKGGKKEFYDTDVEVEEDTEKEEVFELSTPMGGEGPGTTRRPEKEEEVFSLDEINILDDSGEEIDEPDMVLDGSFLEDEGGGPGTEPKKGKGGGEARVRELETEINIPSDTKEVDVPVHITIPKNRDEVRLKLNLHIVFKKT